MRAVALRNGGVRPLGTYYHGVRHTSGHHGGGYFGNSYDKCLSDEYALWQRITAAGLDKLCCPAGRDPYAARPWVEMPDGGREFSRIDVLAVSAITEGVETVVLSEETPFGYDGIINYGVCRIEPPAGGNSNFSEGSGQLTWRLKANQRHLRNMGNIIVSRGSLIDPSPIPNAGLRVYSRNLIQ